MSLEPVDCVGLLRGQEAVKQQTRTIILHNQKLWHHQYENKKEALHQMN